MKLLRKIAHRFFCGRQESLIAQEAQKHKLGTAVSRYVASRQLLEEIYAQLLALTLQHAMPEKGTKAWLEVMEFKYGGTIKNLERRKVGRNDPRTQEQLKVGGMVGGDRMSRIERDYSSVYAEALQPFLLKKNTKIVLAEVGILRGTGLAVWAELFDDARIIGLDIDLSHIQENMSALQARGAFMHTAPELYEFDQYLENRALMEKVLQGDRLDIIIDDGMHYNEAIIATVNSLQPFFADDFLYIIEDNATVHHQLRSLYPDYIIDNRGEITLMRNTVSIS